MDDKEWAAGIQAALNGTLAGNNSYLPGAWAMLRYLARHLPVDVAIVWDRNWDCKGTETQVSVTAKGSTV